MSSSKAIVWSLFFLFALPRDFFGSEECVRLLREGMSDVVERPLEVKGIDVNVQDRYGDTALMRASRDGRLGVVERLLEVNRGSTSTSQTEMERRR